MVINFAFKNKRQEYTFYFFVLGQDVMKDNKTKHLCLTLTLNSCFEKELKTV